MITVRAKFQGFYGAVIKQPGEVFRVKKEEFSKIWMEEVKQQAGKKAKADTNPKVDTELKVDIDPIG